MKNKDVFTEEERYAIELLLQNHEKYKSRLGEYGGFVAKKERSSKLTKKYKIVPLYISKEYAKQILNRKRLYATYHLLDKYSKQTQDATQQRLAKKYMELFDSVQDICINLKDDKLVAEFINFLASKCVSDFNYETKIETATWFSIFPFKQSYEITHINTLQKSEITYIEKLCKHINDLKFDNIAILGY